MRTLQGVKYMRVQASPMEMFSLGFGSTGQLLAEFINCWSG